MSTENYIALLSPILTFLGTMIALYYSHKKTNANIENVENHLNILPGQINARVDPLVVGSVANKENVENAADKDIMK